MKKQIYSSLITLGLFAAMAVAPVYAQFQDPIRVNIPFAFVAGGKQMPAGEYRLTSLVNGSLHSRILIRSKDGQTAVIIGTILVEAKEANKGANLTFNRYGDQYFLSQVWSEDSRFGRQIPKSDVEVRVAASGANGSKVSVAAVKR